MEIDYLVLKRASASRPSGEWSEDDFDVLADGVVVGRIFKAESPAGTPWMWTLAIGYHETARRRTAMRPRARQRWPPSLRAGGERADFSGPQLGHSCQEAPPVLQFNPLDVP